MLSGAIGGWIVLSYRTDPAARPRRPILRAVRRAGVQDFVLPGVVRTRAQWLGLLPADTIEVRLAVAADSGFVVERVGRRSDLSLIGQCLRTRPLKAVFALYERLRGDARRYRDTLRGACAVTPRAAFADWAAARDRPAGHVPDPAPPAPAGEGDLSIRVLVLAEGEAEAAVARTVASLRAQSHRGWQALVVSAAAPTEPFVTDERVAHRPWRDDLTWHDLIAGDAVCLLHAGDRLTPDALSLLARTLARADFAYGDAVAADGNPHLKPDWSPDLALASGYQGRPWLASKALLARPPDGAVGPLAGVALALDITLACFAERVVHVARVLARTVDIAHDAPTRVRALARHRDRLGLPFEPVIRAGVADLLWPRPNPAPLASIVIPSRDRLDLIARISRGILHETDYPAIELIVVDNASRDAGVLAHYGTLRADRRVRIVPFAQAFNFSAMVNAGVAAARGAVVVLVNNDVAVLEPGWLDAMVRQACRPEVGAVGAKLLYADGTLQHAGVVVGLGGRAGHILRKRAGDVPGHLGQMRVAHEVSAVTAACLAVERSKYDAVGGFDAETFPIDFNDVDFCLRLGAAGYKTVWTPAATLAHLESDSRGPSVGPARLRFEAEAARFADRWRAVIAHDPFYHPALSLTTFGEDLE